MPAYSCLQPRRHTYTDNNPQLNHCSSVNISWMADSSGLIIFFDLCLGFVFAFMNYKCMAKFVGKILISPPLHKVEVHSGKRVSAALLCLCREQIFTKHTPILLAAFNSIVDLNSLVITTEQFQEFHWIEVADFFLNTTHFKGTLRYGKVHLSFLLFLWELILTFRDKEKGTQENALDCGKQNSNSQSKW